MLHPAVAHTFTLASDLARQIADELASPEMEDIEFFEWRVTRIKILLAGTETMRSVIIDPTQ